MELYTSSIDHNDAIPYTMEEWDDLGFDGPRDPYRTDATMTNHYVEVVRAAYRKRLRKEPPPFTYTTMTAAKAYVDPLEEELTAAGYGPGGFPLKEK